MDDQVKIPPHVAQFGKRMEEYFGTYTREQTRQIVRWAERYSERTLGIVYQWCVASCPSEYGKPPSVATLNKTIAEVYDSYPELRGDSYNAQLAADAKLLADDAGWTDAELDAALEGFRTIAGRAADARRFDA